MSQLLAAQFALVRIRIFVPLLVNPVRSLVGKLLVAIPALVQHNRMLQVVVHVLPENKGEQNVIVLFKCVCCNVNLIAKL